MLTTLNSIRDPGTATLQRLELMCQALCSTLTPNIVHTSSNIPQVTSIVHPPTPSNIVHRSLSPVQQSILQTSGVPVARLGLDTNGDGRPNVVVTGADLNND